MVLDFSKINLGEPPIIILKNTAGVPIGILGYAINLSADIKYNEASTIQFELPAYVNGSDTPYYNSVVGMRVIELQDVGQFILMDPEEHQDGIRRYKSCKAYSLEYEFTFKNIVLEEGTYNFWNPVAPSGTLLSIILEEMPSWSVGDIDQSLVGKYRTFSSSGEKIYNFIKSTVQESYNCIFDFDTFNRRINVRDASSTVAEKPVYISQSNLAKSIEITEDTESIVTRLDVNGADGVTIRDVNPSGTNTIINLDYFMKPDNFDQALIDKYNRWKAQYENYQRPYYNLSVDYATQTMYKVSLSAELADLQGELTVLENEQAVIIQSIAQNLKSQDDLDDVNRRIRSKENEIDSKKREIEKIENQLGDLHDELKEINEKTNFQKYFTEDEYLLLDRYIKDDSLSESTFVYKTVGAYDDSDSSQSLSGNKISVSGAIVSSIQSSTGKTIYDITGGSLSISGGVLSGNIIHGAFEQDVGDGVLFTAFLSGVTEPNGTHATCCISITGSGTSFTSSNSSLSFTASNGYMYLTADTTEYEKRSVSWDLFEYGKSILDRVSQPSYTFSVTSANFLHLKEFEAFKNSVSLGEKLYVEISEGVVLAPIFIGVSIDWEDPSRFSMEFGDKYVSSDSAFQLADLLDKSVSMGKNVDLSKYTYSAFVDSGAGTSVKSFMSSALDVSKNAIISSKNQAVTWGDSGIRCRQWANDAHTSYDPYQTWIVNNSIMMTKDNWQTASLAIGRFQDANTGDSFGVVAPNIVGTLIAGSNLVIESAKKDGGTSVFKVDADGCLLYNSQFEVVSKNRSSHIVLDPQLGIAVGVYPLFTTSGGTKSINEDNAKFWVDMNGNLNFKGTLQSANGEFDGKITAREGYIGSGSSGWTIGSTSIYNGRWALSNNDAGIYIGVDGISMGEGDHYVRAYRNGLLSANYAIIGGGRIGGCEIQDGKLQVNAAYITGELDANKVTIKNLTVDASQIENLTVDASHITGTLDANKVTIKNLSVDASYVTGTLDASKVTIKNLNADSITAGEIKASHIDGLPASKIVEGQFDSDRINGSSLTITEGSTIAGWRLDKNSIYQADAAWGTGTFMCTGSTGSISIGGSDAISGWVFGAGGNFGVTKDGTLYCSKAVVGTSLSGNTATLERGRLNITSTGFEVSTVNGIGLRIPLVEFFLAGQKFILYAGADRAREGGTKFTNYHVGIIPGTFENPDTSSIQL